jgi:hypothetical protein
MHGRHQISEVCTAIRLLILIDLQVFPCHQRTQMSGQG